MKTSNKQKIFTVCSVALSMLLTSCANTQDENEVAFHKAYTSTGEIIEPIFAVEALYPKSAFDQGLEADCKVVFDLQVSGELLRPHNIIVSDCQNVFVEACESSVGKWLFKTESFSDTNKSRNNLSVKCKFAFAR